MTSGTKERVDLREALNRLVHECRAVLAFEVELREISVLGNTNVNVFKLRIEEAEAALAAVEREGAREAAIRLEEAHWWHPGHFTPVPANKRPDPPNFHYIGCMCIACGRISDLERTAQSPVAPAEDQ